MKNRQFIKRLFACVLSGVMLAALIPMTAKPVEAASYNITYNCCGGGFNIPMLGSGTTDENGCLSEYDLMRTPTLDGFTFDGWYDAPNGGNPIKAGQKFTGDASVYAHWTRQSSTARKYRQIAGEDRFQTAVKIARESYAGFSDRVVIVNGMKFPDALAANAFASTTSSPILLSKTTGLPDCVKDFLTDPAYSFLYVTVIGGEFEDSFYSDLATCSDKYSIVTIAGKDRYETAALLCENMIAVGKAGDTVAVATGLKSADSISFAPWSHGQRIPILLAGKGGQVDSKTKGLIAQFDHVILLGGDSVVSDSCLTADQKNKTNGKSFIRLGGSDRYETSALIAKYILEHNSSYWPWVLTIADGTSGKEPYERKGHFPDALAGGQFASGWPILLVREGDLDSATMKLIKERVAGNHSTTNQIVFLGYAAQSNSYAEIITAIQTG